MRLSWSRKLSSPCGKRLTNTMSSGPFQVLEGWRTFPIAWSMMYLWQTKTLPRLTIWWVLSVKSTTPELLLCSSLVTRKVIDFLIFTSRISEMTQTPNLVFSSRRWPTQLNTCNFSDSLAQKILTRLDSILSTGELEETIHTPIWMQQSRTTSRLIRLWKEFITMTSTRSNPTLESVRQPLPRPFTILLWEKPLKKFANVQIRPLGLSTMFVSKIRLFLVTYILF